MSTTLRSALIGYTGFVGTTLRRAKSFTDHFRSSNIGEISGQEFGLIVCAGVSAAKWVANRAPEADRAGIRTLTDALSTTRAAEFILISTIDVYPDPSSGEDEDATIDASLNHPYGRHRYELEQWVVAKFPLTRIVRLPALFGEGLRKNALYDLLNGNQPEQINPAGVFQWYPMSRLPSDIESARNADLRVVNLFPEPISMAEVTQAFFPEASVGSGTSSAPHYNLRTRHAERFGGRGDYLLDAVTTLGHMARYVAAERSKSDPPKTFTGV